MAKDDRINGMPAADAKKLYAIVEEASAALARFEADKVWRVVKALDLAVAKIWTDDGWGTDFEPPKSLWKDAKQFQKALESRTRQARVVAFPALSVLNAKAAASLFARSFELDLASSDQVSFEANVYRGLWARWKELGKHLPDSTFGELFLRGNFELEALSDAQVRAIPYDALVKALIAGDLPYPSSDDVERLVELHPALAALEGRAELARKIANVSDDFARRLFEKLIAELIVEKHASAEPAVLAYMKQRGPTYPFALGLVIAVGHRPTLERLFAKLPAAFAAKKALAWDPHHTDLELGPLIRAGFGIDAKSASQRFAKYFAPKAVATARGSKLANDIWMIGGGRLVDHHGTRLGTGDPSMISLDKGWASLAAPLAQHPLLGASARRVVKATAEHPQKLIASDALPATTWPGLGAKSSAKSAPKSKAKAKKSSRSR